VEKTLKEKIRIVKEFTETFDRQTANIKNSAIFKTLSLNEFLSDEFITLTNSLNLGWYVDYPKNGTNEEKFISILESNLIDAFIDTLTAEERHRVYDNFFKRQIISKKIVAGKSIVSGKEDYVIFLRKIIENNLLSFYSEEYNGFIETAADTVMTTGSLDEIKTIRKAFKADSMLSKTYANYPLVITNGNLTRDEKIEIIKANYRKKDLNKYTEVIRDYLIDLDDLDDFIEATILQNNRVTKEENGFIDLIKRVFIGMRGEYFHVNNKLNSCLHRKEFVTKYRHFFTTKQVEYLVTTSSWNSQRNVVDFFKILFMDQPFKYKMNVALAGKGVGSALFSGLSNMPKEIIGVEDEEKLFYKFMIEHNNLDDMLNNNFETTMKYLNKFPDLFSEKFRTEFNFEGKTGYYMRDRFNDRRELSTKVINNLTDENIDTFKVFSAEYFDVLGIVDNGSRWDRGETAAIKFNNFINNLLPFFTEINEENDVFKKYLYDNYFSKLNDDDFTNDFVSHSSQLLNDPKAGKEFINELNETNLIDTFKKYFGKLKDFMVVNYPEAIGAIENIEQIRDELIIICIL